MADIILYDNLGYGGHPFPHDSPAHHLDGRITGKVSSLKVNRNGWVIFHSKSSMRGSELYVKGPFEIPNLGEYEKRNPIGFSGNWDNEIASIQYSDAKPMKDANGTFANEQPQEIIDTLPDFFVRGYKPFVQGDMLHFRLYQDRCTNHLAGYPRANFVLQSGAGVTCNNTDEVLNFGFKGNSASLIGGPDYNPGGKKITNKRVDIPNEPGTLVGAYPVFYTNEDYKVTITRYKNQTASDSQIYTNGGVKNHRGLEWRVQDPNFNTRFDQLEIIFESRSVAGKAGIGAVVDYMKGKSDRRLVTVATEFSQPSPEYPNVQIPDVIVYITVYN